MYCSRCGTMLVEGAAYCSACGQALNAPPTVTTAPIPSPAPQFTPSQVPVAGPIPAPLPSPYAGFWLRFVAYIIDSAVLVVVFGTLFLLAIAFLGVGFFHDLGEGIDNADDVFPVALVAVILMIAAVSILASWLYYAWMESSTTQGTLGKMALGLIVTDMQGQRISFGRASGRFFAKMITGLIPLFIGYIMAGFTQKKQALHDMIASCLVLRKM